MAKNKSTLILIITIIVLILGNVTLGIFLGRSSKKAFNTIQKTDSLLVANKFIIKRKTDSIKYFENIISEQRSLSKDYEDTIERIKKNMSKIPDIVVNIPDKVIHERVMEYLPEKTDSSRLTFSNNQVEHIYEEHLELLDARELLVVYEKNTDALYGKSAAQTEETLLLRGINKKLEEQLTLVTISNSELISELEKQKKRSKILTIATPSSFAAGLLVGLVVIL